MLADIDAAAVRTWRADLLDSGVSVSMCAKAYRLLRAVMNTAVDQDELIRRNPCRIRGGGDELRVERPVLSVGEVLELADAVPERFRCFILVTTFASLRFGEVTALTRGDVDLQRGVIRVRRAFGEVAGKGLVLGPPKSAAGRRSVSIPPVIVRDLEAHMDRYVDAEDTALVFTGLKGAPIRRGNFNPQVGWNAAVELIGHPGLHLHDLRHTGNTLAAASGVSTRDLMARMGHDSMNAALMYQHATSQADRVIAQALDRQVRATRHGLATTHQPPLFDGDSAVEGG